MLIEYYHITSVNRRGWKGQVLVPEHIKLRRKAYKKRKKNNNYKC